MGDNCCCDMGDGAIPECVVVKIRTARKSHVCCECGQEIKRGERYEFTSGIWEGEPGSYKTCLICARIRDDYFCSWIFGGLKEEIRECLGVDLV